MGSLIAADWSNKLAKYGRMSTTVRKINLSCNVGA
jgi:hypothetical protein